MLPLIITYYSYTLQNNTYYYSLLRLLLQITTYYSLDVYNTTYYHVLLHINTLLPRNRRRMPRKT